MEILPGIQETIKAASRVGETTYGHALLNVVTSTQARAARGLSVEAQRERTVDELLAKLDTFGPQLLEDIDPKLLKEVQSSPKWQEYMASHK